MNFETEFYGFVVYQRQDIPKTIGLAIGDAVHNLRSALAHTVTACVIANDRPFRDTKFPFASSEETFARRLKEDVRKAGAIAQEIVRNLKPYPGGNEALWALHELDLIDKHRVIVATACVTKVQIDVGLWTGKPPLTIERTFDFSHGKEQYIPFVPGYEKETPTEMRFGGDVVFGLDTPKRGEPCIAVLNEFVTTVSDIIDLFETKCSAGLSD